MNKQQHLLLKLSEECSEVIKEVHKILLFGLNNIGPNDSKTNLEKLQIELNHLFAAVEMLHEVGVPWRIDNKVVIQKKSQVKEFMKYAKIRGTLEEDI